MTEHPSDRELLAELVEAIEISRAAKLRCRKICDKIREQIEAGTYSVAGKIVIVDKDGIATVGGPIKEL